MEDKLEDLQVAAKSFVKRLKPNDIAQVIDFDSRVEIRQTFTGNQAELEGAIGKTAAGGSTSLHNAIYIALKELRKVRAVNEEDVRRQALVVFSDGEDTSSLVSFDEVLDLAKRSETAIYTIALRGVDTQTKGFREAEFVMRQLAQETGGRSFFPSRIDDLSAVYAQIADELASQYTIGYTSKNARRDGAFRRIVVQTTRAGPDAADEEGLLRPDRPVNDRPARCSTSWRASRTPSTSRAATPASAGRPRRRCSSRRWRTPSSSACRRWRCVTFRSPACRRAVSTFVWLLTLSYLYLEITTEERAMGVFILPIVIGLQTISVLSPGVEKSDPVLDSPWFWVHVVSLLFAYASFALAGVLGLTYMLQFKEIKKKHLGYLYTRLPSLLTLDTMNSRAMTVGWVFLTIGVDRRRHLDGAGARRGARRSQPAGDVARRSEDLLCRADVGGVFVRALRADPARLDGTARRVAVGGGLRHRPAQLPAHRLLRRRRATRFR